MKINARIIIMLIVLFTGTIPYIQSQTIQAKAPKGWDQKTGGSIHNIEELLWLSETTEAWDEDWTLEADIDASETINWNNGLGFSPIGDSPNGFGVRQEIAFTGTFDGQGYSISNVYILRPEEPYIGFFGQATGAQIINLHLQNIHIEGHQYIGGLIGYADYNTIINNCSANSYVNGEDVNGGLIGQCYQGVQIESCWSDGTVSGNMWMGGLVGDLYAYCNISNSYSHSETQGTDYLGGLTGSARWYASINNSFATGDNLGSGEFVGGFVGHISDGVITNCFSSGRSQGYMRVGGFVGESLQSENSESGVYKSYSTGLVSAGEFTGGFVGRNYNYVNDCYFDIETSGTTIGIGNDDSGMEAIGILTADFAQENNFNNWDFSLVWTESVNYNISSFFRPYLKWYQQNLFTISFVSEEGGSIVGDSLQSIYLGEETTEVSIIEDLNYHFVGWYDSEGILYSTNKTIVIDNVDSDEVYIAHIDLISNTARLQNDKECVFFPNPVQQVLTLVAKEPSIIEIINMNGKLVREYRISNNCDIDIRFLANGVYTISVQNQRGTTKQKFIKQ